MSDRTATPQAAAGVPDQRHEFLLAEKYHVPYLSLSFAEEERIEVIGKKLQRLNMRLALLTTQEQLDQADEFDALGQQIQEEAQEHWVKLLQRRMVNNAPSVEEFRENVGSRDAEALMRWLQGDGTEGKGE